VSRLFGINEKNSRYNTLKKKIEVLVISFLYFRMIQALKCANTLHEKVDETPTSETGTCGDHSVKFSHKIYMQH
jgi:hypothetical protein